MKTVFSFVCTIFLVNVLEGSCVELNPTFKYVTTYNKAGRLMTEKDLQRESVNVLRPIIFIIGGLKDADKENCEWSKELTDAYTNKFTSNIFIVDWNVPESIDSRSISDAHSVGVTVGSFMNTIFEKTGENYLDVHSVGVSLGCEVAASAARHLKDAYGRNVNRISCLNPEFYPVNGDGENSKILEKGSANFVDVVHENLEAANNKIKQMGNVDYYIDRSDVKYGTKEIISSSQCLGLKSLTIFANSINTNTITARKCDNVDDFRNNVCGKEEIIVGENVNRNAEGKYFLKI